ncbi:CU044_5270 family protein [Streptomyces sporangiiformans]|uniref:CU044_5270 family protein n=1 Tax=Streptomyces sporangiiformans TaxID=2315329 RepID=A0A505DQQ9_9ACTN|nr:CU044_5270 family protein [Streptomyces sporangiiformans]TPQ23567.1 hypothetical protein FGD71_003035 [Streptomyces sporangiiformans]
MADELELLRHANPVPSGDPRFRDRPLDHGAERHLNQLLSARRPRRTRLVWSLATAAVAAVTALALLLAGPSTTPAVAAPGPLVPLAGSTPVSLDRLAARAETAASDGSPRLLQGTHTQSWSLSMTSGPGAERPITLPQERIVRWKADGSHTELVVATDPRHPGEPVITDEGGDPRTVEDGHVLKRQTYPPSWSDAPPQAQPPHDVGKLYAYLEELNRDGAMTTPQLLDVTTELLDHWTLGARESAALARILADAKGLRPVGEVTDRLGRRGQAYVYAETATRRMLILDPATGAVLGLETTFTKDQPEYGVEAGDVMQYSAWMR